MGSKDPLGVYRGWAARYGDMFYYRFLYRKVYFLNHPDLVKQVLVGSPQNFVKGEALRNNRRIFGKGLLTSEGESWRKQRRLIQPAFNHDRIASYGEAMVAHSYRRISNRAGA